MPSAMRVLTTRCTPSAAAIRSTPSASATRSSARLGRRALQPRAAAQEVGRVEQPQDQIGVGHGGRLAAAAVAGGAGLGAGAVRPDMQHAAGIDPGDRAAARADADDVERLQRHPLAGEPPVGGDLRGRRPPPARCRCWCRPCRTAAGRAARSGAPHGGCRRPRRPAPTAPPRPRAGPHRRSSRPRRATG